MPVRSLPDHPVKVGATLVAIGVVLIIVGIFQALIPTPPDPPDPPDPPTAVDYGGYRPHYQGAGTATPGGRGGPFCIVTTIDDTSADVRFRPNGTGTLRQCVAPRPGCADTAATCARMVLVGTSGTVDLLAGRGVLRIDSPFLTLAGQTAPSPGLTIRGAVLLDTHDLVLQHLRARLTKAWGEAMTVSAGDPIGDSWTGWDIVLDHVSLSWGTISGNVAMNWASSRVAVLDSILAEPLRTHPDDYWYGYGALFYSSDNCQVTVARTYQAHQQVRNPLVGAGCKAAVYNNLTYDAGDNYWASQGDAMAGNALSVQALGPYADAPFEVAYLGNVVVNGPITSSEIRRTVGVAIDADHQYAPHKLYLADNTGPGILPTNQFANIGYFYAADARVLCDQACFDAGFSWFKDTGFALLPNAAVAAYVLTNAGARPTDRDPVDARLIEDYTQRDGDAKLDSEADVGGFPPLAVHTRPLLDQLPADPSAVAPGQSVRTNLEVFLEAEAQALEPETGIPPPVTRQAATPPWLWLVALLCLLVGFSLLARRRRGTA